MFMDIFLFNSSVLCFFNVSMTLKLIQRDSFFFYLFPLCLSAIDGKSVDFRLTVVEPLLPKILGA